MRAKGTKTTVIRGGLRDQAKDAKIAFTQCFGKDAPASRLVFKMLSGFCREGSSTFHPDPRVHALLEGRREVLLRIKDFVELPIEELVQKYGNGGDLNGVS